MNNWKYVSVEDGLPAANKKGLRVKVTGMEFDENDVLKAIHFEYSLFHCRGGAVVQVADINPVIMEDVQNG